MLRRPLLNSHPRHQNTRFLQSQGGKDNKAA